jgi:hypothetical protein
VTPIVKEVIIGIPRHNNPRYVKGIVGIKIRDAVLALHPG